MSDLDQDTGMLHGPGIDTPMRPCESPAMLGCLRSNGFSVALAAHAFSVLDAYVFGFVLTEVNLPMTVDEPADDFIAELGPSLDPTAYRTTFRRTGGMESGPRSTPGHQWPLSRR
jgi:hypothetical protein